jgi:hypothetical protein
VTFREKIDKVLKTNAKEITSVNALERFLDLGQGSIAKYMRQKKDPSIKIQRKIIEGLGINLTWWEHQEGLPFKEILTRVVEEDVKYIKSNSPEMLELLRVNNKLLTEKIARLESELEDYKKNALSIKKKEK